jgi:hypothetical protein
VTPTGRGTSIHVAEDARSAQRRRQADHRSTSDATEKGRRPLPADRSLRAALDAQPTWHQAVWGTPARRLAVSVVALALSSWILTSALTNSDLLSHPRATAGFLAAPALAGLFGAQAVQAIVDLARRRNSLPVFHRIGWWLDRRGALLIIVYLAIMIAALLLVRA